MFTDSGNFLKASRLFFIELKTGQYPNASTLATQTGYSKSSAQRIITRLKDEFGFPIDYDSSYKGYYLTNPFFSMDSLPPGKDELTALILLRNLANLIDAEDLKNKLDDVWLSFSSLNPGYIKDLEQLAHYFTSDSTVVARLSDIGLLDFLNAACRGESIELMYKSPWRHDTEKCYRGRLFRVHYSDGNLYLLLNDEEGKARVLNASFVRQMKVLNETVSIPPKTDHGSKNWLEGFGVWAGEEVEEIEIHVLPPAAEYYAAQKWHEEQVDSWHDETLIRKFRGIISPEVVRRILSLGSYVGEVRPQKLKEMVKSEISVMRKRLGQVKQSEKQSTYQL
jgi:predicted DNA-binding transcriptional regulator YafY